MPRPASGSIGSQSAHFFRGTVRACSITVLHTAGSNLPMDNPLKTRSPEELVQLIAETSLFCEVNRSHLNGLKEQLEWVPLPDGEELFHKGAAVDGLSVVADGWFEVMKRQKNLDGEPTNDRLVLAQIGPPATIGKSSSSRVGHGPRRRPPAVSSNFRSRRLTGGSRRIKRSSRNPRRQSCRSCFAAKWWHTC